MWVLFLIVLGDSNYAVRPMGMFLEMNECLAQRNALVEEIGKPIIDYQAICIQKSLGDDDAQMPS